MQLSQAAGRKGAILTWPWNKCLSMPATRTQVNHVALKNPCSKTNSSRPDSMGWVDLAFEEQGIGAQGKQKRWLALLGPVRQGEGVGVGVGVGVGAGGRD